MTNKFIQEINSGSKNALLKREILCYYINHGENTLADLGKEMSLSIPTVTKLVGELIEDGYVIDFGKQETAGGRRPNIYGLNQNSGYFVGVDINHFDMNIGMINFNGVMVNSKMNIPYRVDHSAEKFEELCVIIEDFLNNSGVPREKIISMGINISGRVNTRSGHSYSYFYIDERPLTEIFSERLDMNVSIDNDSRAMTYGEFLNGCVKGEKNVVYINATWGLGMGLIINGELYYGKSGFSGEVGHYPTFDNETLCHCGKKGCLETQASGSFVHRVFMEKLKNGSSSVLSKKYKKGEEIRLMDIINSALQDDMLSIELIEEVGFTLGKAIAGLINIFNPELVVIGGIMAQAGDYLLLPLRSSIKKYSLNLVNSDTSLKLSKLGDKSGILGACMLARSKTIGLIKS
ncbi:MAG: ROK family transcriptional regulator [Bacteroidia bacterium]|nr:ROK family transcriptional regulator [Bacteroidia bacterium]